MCNLSDGVWQKGIERGIEQGIEFQLLNSVSALMENLHLPIDKAMDLLNVTEQQRVIIRSQMTQDAVL